MRELNLPNILTMARLVLAPLIPISFFTGLNPLWLVWNIDYRLAALVLALCLALTDFLDGTLAKLMKQETELGKKLDPIADFVFCVSLFFAAFIVYRRAPILICLWIAFGAYFLWYAWTVTRLRRKGIIDKADWYAKASMCALMISLLLIIPSSFKLLFFAAHSSQNVINDILAIFGVLTAVALAGQSLEKYEIKTMWQIEQQKK